MEVIFWNIGESITAQKQKILNEIIHDWNPEVICIAEGTNSITDNINLINGIVGYDQYVNPLILKNEGFSFNSNCLKVFTNTKTFQTFELGFQTRKGRIVMLKHESGLVLVFLHNNSKEGSNHGNDKQLHFLTWLNVYLTESHDYLNLQDIILMGDFNLEPWDNMIRRNEVFNNYFRVKDLNLSNRINGRTKNNFFNPLLDFVTNHKNINLNGTYYNENYGWALFDYPIYNCNRFKIDFDIITSTKAGTYILSNSKSLKNSFLINGIDHLPIKIKINNI